MIISDDAEHCMEIDALKSKKEKEDAEAYMTKKTENIDMVHVETQLRRALVKLKVSKEYGKFL
jgi:F0F1-type ATP synthase epsilon subunit